MKYYLMAYRDDTINKYKPLTTKAIFSEGLEYKDIIVTSIETARQLMYESEKDSVYSQPHYAEHWLDNNITFASELTEEEAQTYW